MSSSGWFASRFRAIALPAVIFWTLGTLGCADLITYSKDSTKEGQRLYGERQYADAAGAFHNAIRQDPQNYEARFGLGNSYSQIGQYHQAIQAYEACLDVMNMTLRGREDSTTRNACRDALAIAIARSDDRATETSAIEKRAHDSGLAENYLILAKVFRNEGDADSAIEAYSQATLMASKDFDMQKEYGLYLDQLGLSQRAEAPLRRAYALNNNDPEVTAALRRIGVVPGPSLQDEKSLAKPLIPKGPLPEVNFPKSTPPSTPSTTPPAEPPAPATPRD